MAEHGESHHKQVSAKKGGGGKEILRPFVEGMAELARESGLGAIEDAPNTIADLFGAGSGSGKSNKGHH